MLRRILLIARRDYTAAVMTKAFVIGLVVLPLLMGSGFLGFALLRVTQGDTAKRIAIVDHTGIAAAAIIRAAEIRTAEDKTDKTRPAQIVPNRFVFEEVRAADKDAAGQRLALSDQVRHREISGFLEIGKDALDASADRDKSSGQVALYTGTGNMNVAQAWLTGVIDQGLTRARLARAGVDQSRFEDALRGVPMESRSLVSRDEKTGEIRAGQKSSGAETAIPIVLMILMVMMTMLGAASMLSVVAEDKIHRVFEMLLASVTPFELMAGKVLASVGVSLTSSVFYILGGLLVMEGMAVVGMAPLELLPWFFVYIICQVTMLSAMGAALGSACNAPRDAQQLTPLVIMPIMAPIILIAPLIQEPNGVFTTALSFFPPFTPAVMMMRQAMPGGVPSWQPWLGLLGVVVWTLALTWAAARIFRVGLLLQGKTPKVAELLRWAVRG
jgi:ABC-2 type transport system permease protein